MDISDIIKENIEPIKESECERLGLPSGFVTKIEGFNRKAGDYGRCNPVIEKGR